MYIYLLLICNHLYMYSILSQQHTRLLLYHFYPQQSIASQSYLLWNILEHKAYYDVSFTTAIEAANGGYLCKPVNHGRIINFVRSNVCTICNHACIMCLSYNWSNCPAGIMVALTHGDLHIKRPELCRRRFQNVCYWKHITVLWSEY